MCVLNVLYRPHPGTIQSVLGGLSALSQLIPTDMEHDFDTLRPSVGQYSVPQYSVPQHSKVSPDLINETGPPQEHMCSRGSVIRGPTPRVPLNLQARGRGRVDMLAVG